MCKPKTKRVPKSCQTAFILRKGRQYPQNGYLLDSVIPSEAIADLIRYTGLAARKSFSSTKFEFPDLVSHNELYD